VTLCVVAQSLMDVLGGLTKSSVDGDRLSVEDQLTDLRLLTSYLENELNVVRQENADFRRDMMTSSLRNHASLTADDVNRLMEKIVELMNGSTIRPSISKHAAAGLPRGTTKGAITSKTKHAIKHKTSPATLAQLLQPSLAFCFSLQPMTAYRPELDSTPSLAAS